MSLESWQIAKLSSIASVIDCPHSTPKWTDSGYFVIRNWNVREGRLDRERASYTDKENFLDRIRRAKPEYMDLVLTREAPMGEVCMIPQGIECCLGQRVVLIKPKKSVVDPRFLLFSIQAPFVKNQIMSHEGTGSTVSNLRIPAIENLDIVLPDLPIQRRIADILSALDDKIELNRQTNATLEAMAQVIFKEWFVDFNYPGATGELVDSELGLIPAGWRVGKLEDVLILQRGFDLPSDKRIPGEYPVLAASGPSGTHNEFMVHGPGVTTGRSGVLGKVFYVHDDFWPLNTSLWVKEFKNSSPLYAFHLLQGIDFNSFNAGSAVPTLNRNHVHSLPALLPPMGIIHAFDEIIYPLMRRQKVNEEESAVLSQLRDNLLPKLMSGMIEL